MSIDWSYPSQDAINAMHAYSTHDKAKGYPDGTTQAAYDSWTAYANSHGTAKTGASLDGWADSVRAQHPEWVEAHQWYNENIVGDGWDKLVEDFKKHATDPSNVNPPGFNDKPDWIDDSKNPTNSGFDPSGIKTSFTGDSASTSGTAVNTAALEWFANDFLGAITGEGHMLLQTADLVGQINPKPGAFARAEVLRQAIVGATAQDGGVKGDTKDMLINMNTTLLAMKEALLKMAKQYRDVEELNGLTTDKLNEYLGDSFQGLNGISGYGSKTVKTDGNA